MRAWATHERPSREDTGGIRLRINRDLKSGKLDMIPLSADQALLLAEELLQAARRSQHVAGAFQSAR